MSTRTADDEHSPDSLMSSVIYITSTLYMTRNSYEYIGSQSSVSHRNFLWLSLQSKSLTSSPQLVVSVHIPSPLGLLFKPHQKFAKGVRGFIVFPFQSHVPLLLSCINPIHLLFKSEDKSVCFYILEFRVADRKQ